MIRFYLLLIVLFSSASFAKTIVVLGDSLSAGYGMPMEKGWVSLLQQTLHEQNSPYRLINKSISGDTTAGGLGRIGKALDQYSPEIVIIELGANDGLRGMPPILIKKNLAELIRRIRKTGARVLLLSMRIPPNYGKRYTDMFYRNYLDLAEETGAALVPFILQDIALVKAMMQQDGLHPSEKAQPIIANKVWTHLAPLLTTEEIMP